MDEAWCFAFFDGAVCSGVVMVLLSGASAGVASTTFDGSPAAGNAVAAEADALAGADAGAAVPALTAAMGSADVVWAAAGVVGNTAAVDAAGIDAAAFAADDTAGWLDGAVRADVRQVSGLSLAGAVATEVGGDAGFAGAVTTTDVAVGAAGATDGTAAARTLVTIARAVTGFFSGSLGRSIRESTTPAPAVAPIAMATKTTRAVRAKLGAGAK